VPCRAGGMAGRRVGAALAPCPYMRQPATGPYGAHARATRPVTRWAGTVPGADGRPVREDVDRAAGKTCPARRARRSPSIGSHTMRAARVDCDTRTQQALR
jgi:hypothetical protein